MDRMSALHITPLMRERNFVLACKAYPKSDLLIALE
jgi:hypothetical protein